MGGKHAIGPDVVALSIPIGLAFVGFSTIVFRAFAYDPEWTNGLTQEDEAATNKGDVYRNQIKGYFVGPDRGLGQTSLFNNTFTPK
eukprot:gene15485-21570_t